MNMGINTPVTIAQGSDTFRNLASAALREALVVKKKFWQDEHRPDQTTVRAKCLLVVWYMVQCLWMLYTLYCGFLWSPHQKSLTLTRERSVCGLLRVTLLSQVPCNTQDECGRP